MTDLLSAYFHPDHHAVELPIYCIVTDDKVDETTRVAFGVPRTSEGYTLGAGLKLPPANHTLLVDYAYTEFGILGNVHRLSLQFELFPRSSTSTR